MGPILLDSSGIVCLLSPNEKFHEMARHVMRGLDDQRRPLLTTDHILGETYTLLKARRKHQFIHAFRSLLDSGGIQVAWTDGDAFKAAEQYFLRHADKNYSFVDCLSFVVMKERRITEALTADHHFTQAGFRALLIPS